MNILQLISVRWFNACAYYALLLAYGLKKKGYHVIVATSLDSPTLIKAQEYGLKVYSLQIEKNYNPVILIGSLIKLIKIIKKENIELINAHRAEDHLFGYLAIRLSKKNIPLVRTRGDVRVPKNNFINRYLHKKVDKIITSAEFLKTAYKEVLSIEEDKIDVIYPGIDLEEFDKKVENIDIRKNFNLARDTNLVGIIGRLSEIKGHYYFIKAARLVKQYFDNVKFVIIGGEAELKYDDMKKLAQQENITNDIIYLGYINDIREVIHNFDIGIISSIGSEAISRTLLEFMAAKKAVVGFEINAVSEIIKDNETGYLVVVKDINSLAEAIINLLKDKDKRVKFGETARRLIEQKYNLNYFVDQTERVYEKVLSSKYPRMNQKIY